MFSDKSLSTVPVEIVGGVSYPRQMNTGYRVEQIY